MVVIKPFLEQKHRFLFVFSSQNEPTFYTEDGTPFTAADPGEATAGEHVQIMRGTCQIMVGYNRCK